MSRIFKISKIFTLMMILKINKNVHQLPFVSFNNFPIPGKFLFSIIGDKLNTIVLFSENYTKSDLSVLSSWEKLIHFTKNVCFYTFQVVIISYVKSFECFMCNKVYESKQF